MIAPSCIYLDYNATAPLHPAVIQAMSRSFELVGNPSSKHRAGQNVAHHLHQARQNIVDFLSAQDFTLIFTSGASESNSITLKQDWSHIYISEAEHPSVADFPHTSKIPLSSDATLNMKWLEQQLQAHSHASKPALVSIQTANSEMGFTHDMSAISELVHKYNAVLHTDATQAFGRIPLDLAQIKADLITLSPHKAGGPKGIGALLIHKKIKLTGRKSAQEFGLRGGTENIYGAIGFAALCPHICWSHNNKLRQWHKNLEQTITARHQGRAHIFHFENKLPNISVLSFPLLQASSQIIQLDLANIAVASGAACNSNTASPMTSLRALGYPDSISSSSIRISSGWNTSEKDLLDFLQAWEHMIAPYAKEALP